MKKKKINKGISLICIILLTLSSCGSLKNLNLETIQSTPCTLTLKNGTKKDGILSIPNSSSTTVSFKNNNGENDIHFSKIEKIELYNKNAPTKKHIISYMPYNKKGKRIWVVKIAQGKNIEAYISAPSYFIDASGFLSLTGYKQRIQHGNGATGIINPSFPIYMIKKGEKTITAVGVRGGVSNESSALRAGLSRYLSDDAKLCEYLRAKKWGYSDMQKIVDSYVPNRDNAPLIIDGIQVKMPENYFLSEHLNKEFIFYFETAISSTKQHKPEYSLGIKLSSKKFISYGADLGYTAVDYVDETKRVINHLPPKGNWFTDPVIDEDFSRGGLFAFKTYLGGHLPMNINKLYIIPGAYAHFGGMFGEGYGALNYGPMATLDLGLKLKYGNIVFLGFGYRHIMPLKLEEEKVYSNYDDYAPFNNFSLRLSYKF